MHLQHAAFWWMLSTWETSFRFFFCDRRAFLSWPVASRSKHVKAQRPTHHAETVNRPFNYLRHLGDTRRQKIREPAVCRDEGVGPLCEWSSGDYHPLASLGICFWKFTGSWPVAVSQMLFAALVPGTRRLCGFNTSNAASEMCRRNSLSHRFYLSSIWSPVFPSNLPHTIRSLQAFRSSMHTDTRSASAEACLPTLHLLGCMQTARFHTPTVFAESKVYMSLRD